MSDRDLGGIRLAALDALEEVAHVVVALVKADSVGGQGILLELLDGLAVEVAAVDEHAPLVADEHDAVALLFLDSSGRPANN